VSGPEIATVIAVAVLAAFVQNSAGFGFALMAVPLMALAVDTHDTVVICTVLGLLSSSAQAWLGRADTDRVIARRMTASALVGMPFGLAVFIVVSDDALRLLVGVSVLVIVGLLARRIDLRHVGPHFDVAAGALSGVLATSVSTNGPPLVFALAARQVDPHVFRPTINTVFAVSGVVSLLAFTLAGEVTGRSMSAVGLAIPGLLVGMWAGVRAQPHVDGRFRVVVLTLLSIAGTSAILAALG
jgi:uncharacterized protein